MTKPLHSDYCTHIKNEEDKDILTRKLFDVNMRLYKTSEPYRNIVQQCAEYLLWWVETEKEGYKKPHGVSGANAGIPFNIVAIPGEVMLNPKITYESGEDGRKKSMSNCGSLTLEEPIEIWRYEYVDVEYFRLDGTSATKSGYLPTLQHEIDHNNGILITDRKV